MVKVEAATGDHDANGEAEQAVQKIEDEVRTIKDSLEDSLGERVPLTHDILTWLVDHVASIDRRASIGKDGKTPYRAHQRQKGPRHNGRVRRERFIFTFKGGHI